MSSVTGREERFPGAHWSSEVQPHFGFSASGKGGDFQSTERPSPEGAGGSRCDPRRNMCQRADAVPSYMSLPGSVGDRIRSTMFSGRTICRGAVPANPGFGRSDRKVAWCEKCSATLVALKKQALSLAVHHHFSCKDSGDLSAFLNDNLRVHSRSTAEFMDRDREQGQCGTCGTSLNQLKQEAIHVAQSRGQSLARPPFEPSLSAGSLLGQSERNHGASWEAAAAVHQPRSQTYDHHSPRSPRTPQRTPQTLRRKGLKLPNPDMGRWVEEQQQLVASKSVSSGDRVTAYPHNQEKVKRSCYLALKSPRRGGDVASESSPDGDLTVSSSRRRLNRSRCSRKAAVKDHFNAEPQMTRFSCPTPMADDATLGCGDAGAVEKSSKLPHFSRVVTIANTAAMSFLARAAEKLSLMRKKGQASDPAPAHFSTCFREIVQKHPPSMPPCLQQAATRTKDSPNVGKVKVVLRVNPTPSVGQGQPPVLWTDPSKKRITIMEPLGMIKPHATMTLGREGKHFLKTFNFDSVYNQESSQAEVCAGVLADVIRCVLSGSDGCVLGLGCDDVGSWSSMVGSDESVQKLGLIPCAISWLYSAIERRREKTWTDLSVSVSALELCCGEEDTLRDLLGEVPSLDNIQDSPKAHIKIQDDPISGIQLRNHNRVKAPTAERAACLLDAAITARRHTDFITYLCHSSIMFFTFYVQPPRTDSSTIGKGSRGPVKLTMIDVCSGMRGSSKNNPPHSELGPIVLSLLSGHKTTPNKGNKLAMLLRESLGHLNCHITVIAQVADSLANLQETLSTVQLASRIRRTQKGPKPSTSCSPCGKSLPKGKRGPQPLTLRAFHSTDEVDVDVNPLRLRGDLDERSSSDQSCDTVIQIDSGGLVKTKSLPKLTQPKFVPIIPSLHHNKADLDDPEFTALLQELLRIPQMQGEKPKEDKGQGHVEILKADVKPPVRDCLKCETFAELQERLGCIDGSEMIIEALKTSSKGASVNHAATKSQPQRVTGKQKDSTSSKQTLLNQGIGCSQASAGEMQTDGAFPGDSFQREDSGLYDCEECSATSSSEELLNQALSLNKSCCSDLTKDGNQKSGDKFPSHDFDMDAQGKSITASLQYPRKRESSETADWFKQDKRASPVGKSSPISPSSSCSSSQSLATSVIHQEVLPNDPTEDVKEVKATITVTVQQPLDLKGQDELVYSMVEEVTISGALNKGRTGGNIICIRDTPESQGKESTCSKPIRIISNIGEESETARSTDTRSSVVQPLTTEDGGEKPHNQFRREKRFLPSFINPMLIDADVDCDLDCLKEQERTDTLTRVKLGPELKRNIPEDRKKSGADTSEVYVKKPVKKAYDSIINQISYDPIIFKGSAFGDDAEQNKTCGKQPRSKEKRHPRAREHFYSPNAQQGSGEGEAVCTFLENAPRVTGVPPGCHETATAASFQTSSLPRVWQNAHHQERHHGSHVADRQRGVTSSNPCSPGVTLERRQGRQHSLANRSLHVSSPREYGPEYKQDAGGTHRKGDGSLLESSSPNMKRSHLSGRLKSPTEHSGRLFSAKLEQLASRTNSLGRTPRDFPSLDRGSSNTSMSSKGSSKGSIEGTFKRAYKGNEGNCTLPRASRSPRKHPRPDQSHHFFPSESHAPQSAKHSHSKLSAVGKLRIASPKVRRLSAPSIKNLPHKGLRQSISRSASLSPDCKAVSFERTSSFFSSSPPRSFHSISRTPSQSSTCSSTKSAIQGFLNGRVSDLIKERATSPTLGGADHMTSLPSPYSQVTAPRMPDHMSGHASDTTSVLSGDLPPAMGKTSLYFSNRNSVVSSGYDSMMRDSEATGSSASNRGSVSDRSGSLLSVTRSSRSSRKKGSSGSHQRRPSHDTRPPLRRSASGLRSRWADLETPEAYEIKVYEIDNMQRMQKRAGAGKQGPACYSAKLTLWEHRQQRISEARAKYNNLRRELDQAKNSLMLEPAKWNKEFDLWQTFEVDSLEHLEALEDVTARLQNKVSICKANVMMVTSFDITARSRHKKRRRKTPEQRGLKAT